MLRKRPAAASELRPGDKVIAVAAIGRIPEGTRGTVKLVDGFRWTRYWVAWETGDWMGSIDGPTIVAAERIEEYRRERADAAARAADPVATGAPVPTGEAVAAVASSAGGSRVPEHLLERSRAARARRESQPA